MTAADMWPDRCDCSEGRQHKRHPKHHLNNKCLTQAPIAAEEPRVVLHAVVLFVQLHQEVCSRHTELTQLMSPNADNLSQGGPIRVQASRCLARWPCLASGRLRPSEWQG